MINKRDGFKLPASVLKSNRQKLSDLVRQVIDSGVEQRSLLRERWEVLEKMYRMEPNCSGSEIFEGQETRTTPLLHSRVKRLVDITHGALVTVTPHCKAIPYEQSQEGADILEESVQATIDAEEFGEYQRLALRDAALCGVGVLWLPLKEGTGIELTHIHPGQFFCLPNISHDTRTLYAMGHMSKVPYHKLWDMQDRGELPKDAEFMPGNSEHTLADGSSPENTVTLIEDKELPLDYQLVEVWNVLLYCQIGNRTGWWAIMFAEDTSQVLKCEPYEYALPWYAIYRIHLEPSRFWPEVPVANNLQSLQHMHSTLSAILEQGGVASAVGILVLNGVLDGGKKLTSIKPGSVHNLTQTGAGVGAQAIFPAINISSIPGILAKVEQDADAAVAVGRIATNQELNDATATEVQALQASQAQSENAYAAIAASGLEQAFAITAGYWRDSYDTMQKVYGRRIDIEELVKVSGMDVEWKAAGRAPDATPQAQMQKLQALYQLAQNPMSVLDPAKVEERIVREMGLGDIDDLLKKEQDDYSASAGMVDQAGVQGVPGMAQGAAVGGPGIPGENGAPAF